nr:right-handed parallel beta-helix repeat-containing protein [bacterium]
MRRLAVSVLLITTISAISLATTIHIPDDQSTIQAGLNTAVEGDTVLVASGTYVENIIWPAVNGIKLIGSGQEDCIIDGDSLGSVIRFEEDLGGIIDSSTLITGFVIQNGFSSVGGGIYFFTANPQLIDVTISGNTGYRGGGGIHCLYSNPTLTNVMITDNLAGPAEGSAGGGICCLGSNPTLTNVIITNNSVYAVWGAGSGIYCHNSCPTLSNVTISGNLGVFWGGGIACRGVSNPVLTNVTITGNGAYWGGGIYC